ncbi:MAG: hypothetical protein AB1425_03270 [Actinomycetota bacterium]
MTFEISTPVEDPRAISGLPCFSKGLPGAASGRLARLRDLARVPGEEGLADGIGLAVRLADLAGKSYESRYMPDPLCENRRLETAGHGRPREGRREALRRGPRRRKPAWRLAVLRVCPAPRLET